MTVLYTPTFTHTDWVDNQDRVQAAGGNGFNVRFHGIEAEFAALQLVVRSINDALTALSIKPPPQPQATAFTPNLVPTTNLPGQQWQHQDGIAFAKGQTAAAGMMDVQLPSGSTVNTLRLIGNKGSGNVNVTLRRQPIAAGLPRRRWRMSSSRRARTARSMPRPPQTRQPTASTRASSATTSRLRWTAPTPATPWASSWTRFSSHTPLELT